MVESVRRVINSARKQGEIGRLKTIRGYAKAFKVHGIGNNHRASRKSFVDRLCQYANSAGKDGARNWAIDVSGAGYERMIQIVRIDHHRVITIRGHSVG